MAGGWQGEGRGWWPAKESARSPGGVSVGLAFGEKSPLRPWKKALPASRCLPPPVFACACTRSAHACTRVHGVCVKVADTRMVIQDVTHSQPTWLSLPASLPPASAIFSPLFSSSSRCHSHPPQPTTTTGANEPPRGPHKPPSTPPRASSRLSSLRCVGLTEEGRTAKGRSEPEGTAARREREHGAHTHRGPPNSPPSPCLTL